MQRTSNRVVQTSTSVKSCMLFFVVDSLLLSDVWGLY